MKGKCSVSEESDHVLLSNPAENFHSNIMSSVLVFNGLSSVGVELVKLLVSSDQCSHIRVVDKSFPQLAAISDGYRSVFAQVDYRQGNLISARTPKYPA
jgi:hypothetical protein